jgi:hypothetical protein
LGPFVGKTAFYLLRHKGVREILQIVSYTPYTDNTYAWAYVQLGQLTGRVRGRDCAHLGCVTCRAYRVLVDGQKQGTERDAKAGRARSRCGKPRSRSGVEVTAAIQSVAPRFGAIIHRFLHVTPYDDLDAPMEWMPIAHVFLYPSASRITPLGSMSPQYRVSAALAIDAEYFVHAGSLGRVVAFSPSARLPGTYTMIRWMLRLLANVAFTLGKRDAYFCCHYLSPLL